MTTTVRRNPPDGRGAVRWSQPNGADGRGGLPGQLRPRSRRRSVRGWFAGHPAWPIAALLIGWPAWWVLGTSDYMPILFAIPMIRRMQGWRSSGRRIRKPPGFALWLLFLLVVVASLSAISLTAPGTVPSPVSNRLISFSVRFLQYACGHRAAAVRREPDRRRTAPAAAGLDARAGRDLCHGRRVGRRGGPAPVVHFATRRGDPEAPAAEQPSYRR